MQYQKIINLLDNTNNQSSKFVTKNWTIEHRNFGVGSEIRFKPSMMKSSHCDYSDAYILLKWTITTAGARADVVV